MKCEMWGKGKKKHWNIENQMRTPELSHRFDQRLSIRELHEHIWLSLNI